MEKIILLADSGSTKTDWLLLAGNSEVARIATQGINPFMLDEAEIAAILTSELLADAHFVCPDTVHFYGAGCRGAQCGVVERALRSVMPTLHEVIVDSDLVGAARALCGNADGIACILGTGSNSCLYVSRQVVANVSPLGYILGDEGSGAVLGRRLVGDVLKHQLPDHLCSAFHARYAISADEMIRRVYREPFANRFLTSFAPFLSEHKADAAIQQLLHEEFDRFFKRNICSYGRPDLPVSFVGSVAYYFQDVLRSVAAANGYAVGRVLRSPLS